MVDKSFSFFAITNIPNSFRAADLRLHFTSFVEDNSFVCFHYRHRPEKKVFSKQEVSISIQEEKTNVSSTSILASEEKSAKRCCVIKLKKSRVCAFMKNFNNKPWKDVSYHEYPQDKCQISLINVIGAKAKHSAVSECEEEKLLAMPEMQPPELMPNGNVGTPTRVFLDFIQRCLLPDRLINTLKLKFPKTQGKRIYSNVDFHYPENELKLRLREKQGIKQYMKLNFQGRKESNSVQSQSKKLCCGESVFFEDERKIKEGERERERVNKGDFLSRSDETETLISRNKQSDLINSQSDSTYPRSSSQDNLWSKNELKRLKKLERKEMLAMMNENIEEHLIRVERKYLNDEDAEEWDRHEAMEDDPSNQERNKERLYEEEIEQPWEKGGPGVVFYTDAIYWQAKEGDFDEQTTDDLDVDFSPYEGDGPGDKDIQDFLKIRQEQRFRNGYDKTDRFSIGIGKRVSSKNSCSSSCKSCDDNQVLKLPESRIGQFEAHTKGIGRKILEKQGWRDWQGLGRNGSGMRQALKGDGQKPQIKKGLGYVEKKPASYIGSRVKKTLSSEHIHLTTSTDNPHETDPKEKFLQRQEPTTLKHRQSVLDRSCFKTNPHENGFIIE